MKTETYDYIIVGSGFGGSVSAMRLAEKGYKVLVLEKGKRFEAKDFPKTNWDLRRFFWAPLLKCFGIQAIKFFRNVFVLHGVGVGGGSLVYANTLMTPSSTFFKNPIWPKNCNWEETLKPFYKKAKFMLGAATNPYYNKEDEVLAQIAKEDKNERSFSTVEVGVYFSDTEEEIDPYFNGEGPLRSGCTECAGCLIGCQHNAKNTLDKNYLFFAEKHGAVIRPESFVDRISYKDEKYEIEVIKSTSWFKHRPIRIRSNGLIISGGVLGSMELLLKQKFKYKTLPYLSNKLGATVRTNSESLCGVTSETEKLNHGLAITSIYNPSPETHIEITKYPNRSTVMKWLAIKSIRPGKHFLSRPLKAILNLLLHPLETTKALRSKDWAKHSVIFLVMQNLENSIDMTYSRFPFFRLKFKNNSDQRIPSYIKEGQQVMERYAKKVNGTAQNTLPEVMFNMSATAHILGGAILGENDQDSVVNQRFEVHNYPNMYILDGSIIPCNIGVNPSLTITALSEYAMSLIPIASNEPSSANITQNRDN